MKYLGRAITVAQLVKLLENISGEVDLEISGMDGSCPCVEVWYDPEIDSVVFK
jgi:hypothetical protein